MMTVHELLEHAKRLNPQERDELVQGILGLKVQEIEADLIRMAQDPYIQHELALIDEEFRITEWDGLENE